MHGSMAAFPAVFATTGDEIFYNWILGCVIISVAVPDPNPPDPHVFGPPGSGSISQRYGSGSGFFYH